MLQNRHSPLNPRTLPPSTLASSTSTHTPSTVPHSRTPPILAPHTLTTHTLTTHTPHCSPLSNTAACHIQSSVAKPQGWRISQDTHPLPPSSSSTSPSISDTILKADSTTDDQKAALGHQTMTALTEGATTLNSPHSLPSYTPPSSLPQPPPSLPSHPSSTFHHSQTISLPQGSTDRVVYGRAPQNEQPLKGGLPHIHMISSYPHKVDREMGHKRGSGDVGFPPPVSISSKMAKFEENRLSSSSSQNRDQAHSSATSQATIASSTTHALQQSAVAPPSSVSQTHTIPSFSVPVPACYPSLIITANAPVRPSQSAFRTVPTVLATPISLPSTGGFMTHPLKIGASYHTLQPTTTNHASERTTPSPIAPTHHKNGKTVNGALYNIHPNTELNSMKGSAKGIILGLHDEPEKKPLKRLHNSLGPEHLMLYTTISSDKQVGKYSKEELGAKSVLERIQIHTPKTIQSGDPASTHTQPSTRANNKDSLHTTGIYSSLRLDIDSGSSSSEDDGGTLSSFSPLIEHIPGKQPQIVPTGIPTKQPQVVPTSMQQLHLKQTQPAHTTGHSRQPGPTPRTGPSPAAPAQGNSEAREGCDENLALAVKGLSIRSHSHSSVSPNTRKTVGVRNKRPISPVYPPATTTSQRSTPPTTHSPPQSTTRYTQTNVSSTTVKKNSSEGKPQAKPQSDSSATGKRQYPHKETTNKAQTQPNRGRGGERERGVESGRRGGGGRGGIQAQRESLSPSGPSRNGARVSPNPSSRTTSTSTTKGNTASSTTNSRTNSSLDRQAPAPSRSPSTASSRRGGRGGGRGDEMRGGRGGRGGRGRGGGGRRGKVVITRV